MNTYVISSRRIMGLMVIGAFMLISGPIMAAEFITNQSREDFMASNLIGEPVMNQNNETIGDINDLVFDKGQNLFGVVIGVGGFLGIGEKDVAVPYSLLEIKRGEDGLVVLSKLSKQLLESAPAYKTIDEAKGGVTEKLKLKFEQLTQGDDEKDKAPEVKADKGESKEDMQNKQYRDVRKKVKNMDEDKPNN